MTAAEAIARVGAAARQYNRSMNLEPPSIWWYRHKEGMDAERTEWKLYVADIDFGPGKTYRHADLAQVVGMLAADYPLESNELNTQDQAELNDWLDHLPVAGAD